MIVGAPRACGGIGILGHVYTRPDHRQKGAYGALMAAQMAHCAADGYRVLCLGTGFETPPYWIYHKHGFRSIDGISGKMKWLADPMAENDYFRSSSTRVRPMHWDDWAPLELLAYQPLSAGEPLPRSVLFGVKGQGSIEGPFQTVQRRLRRKERISAVVLESERGATVGWAALQPDPFAFGDALQLDLYAHDSFCHEAPRLLEALPLPATGRVNAYTTLSDDYRSTLLEGAGFRRSTTLPDHLNRGGERIPLHVYTRAA
jgi:hypothetical protein